jgi:hypothetical protein
MGEITSGLIANIDRFERVTPVEQGALGR